MSAIPLSMIRRVNTVIHLILEVNDSIVSIQIHSIIPPFSQRRHRSCGGVLQCNQGGIVKYALIQSRYTGKWGFPKGKYEVGETALQCALREIEEEIGIWKLDAPVGRFTAPGKQTYFVFHVEDYLPLRPSDTLEVSATGWITTDEMSRLDTNRGVKTFLQWNKRK